MTRLLEDRPLRAGDALVDMLDDVRGRLVVRPETREHRRRNRAETIGTFQVLSDPITWNSLGPFIVW
jgi:hypothetical protein